MYSGPDSSRKSTNVPCSGNSLFAAPRNGSTVIPGCYKGQCVGEYVPDLVIEGKVIVELKCVDRISSQHLAQCINYLKAARLPVALLINFQNPRVEWKRVLLDQ